MRMTKLLAELRRMVMIEINGHDERLRRRWLDLLDRLDAAAIKGILLLTACVLFLSTACSVTLQCPPSIEPTVEPACMRLHVDEVLDKLSVPDTSTHSDHDDLLYETWREMNRD